MSSITVKVIEGVFDAEQRQQMIRRLTDALVEIEGQSMRAVTWCIVEEVPSGDWGVGGTPVSAADVQTRAVGDGR